nr:ribonuclease H-like domain-containing protein [Tanacetum cinerariifolium]
DDGGGDEALGIPHWTRKASVKRYCEMKSHEERLHKTALQRKIVENRKAMHLKALEDFLLAILIDGLGQHMSSAEYRTIIKYRLIFPLFSIDAICPVCRKTCLDSFGEHAVHCKELPGFKYRHDMVRDVLFDICRRDGISTKKEAPVNFLTNPLDERSTLRPADVLVFGWVGGKHACVDLTGVSTLVELNSRVLQRACSNFQENVGMKSIFITAKPPSPFFKVDERMICIEISGLPLCAWGSNAHKRVASMVGKFMFFEAEESTAMSEGRVCIAKRSQKLISEKIHIEVRGESFEVQVQEIGSCSINISDNSLDTSSHIDINDVVKVADSVENNPTDTLLKQPEVLREKEVNKDEVSNHAVEMSDPSRPPGFEHINRYSSYTSKCSTSFARHHKKDIKRISIIHELNIIIEVGTSLGYDVRGCRKSLNQMINGIGRWKGLVGNYFMINIYAPQESSAKFSLWNKIAVFMQHQDGKFILFGDMNIVRHENERFGYIISNYEAGQFNSFIHSSGLINLSIGGCYYTWMNKAGTKLSKLDRFLIFEDILDTLPDTRITALDRLWSDHTPILLHVLKSDFGPSPFKIYNSWLLRDVFDEAIKFAWSSLETNSNGCNIKSHDDKLEEEISKHNGIMQDGNWILDPNLVKDDFLNFFKDKFQAHDSEKWNWSRKDIGIRNTAYLRDMILKISQVDLNAVDDHCVWTMAKDGILSVGESRRIIDFKLLPSLVPSTSWDKKLSRKVNIFIWRLVVDRLPHRWNVSAWGIDIPSISCPSWNSNVESSSRIFFDCDLSKEVWKLVHNWCDISIPSFSSFELWKACAFSTMTNRDLTWNMDTCASSHLNSHTSNLNTVYNKFLYPSVCVGDGKSIPVTNTGHNILPTLNRPLHLHNVLVTPNIIKNLIYVRQFTRDNNYTIEFDAFGFSVKDFLTRYILFRCDSSGDLYPVTSPSPTPHALLYVSPSTWHQRLGHPEEEVLRSLVSRQFISCNKDKSSHVCHACQLEKHVRLPFSSSNSIVSCSFEIVHSEIWTSPVQQTPLSPIPQPTTQQQPAPSPTTSPPSTHNPTPAQNPQPQTHPMITCSQVGTFKPNPQFHGHTSHISPLPKSHSVALSDPHWRDAMYDEYNALIKNGTWILVSKPPNVNVVRSMWLFRYKYHVDGSLSKYKARLVANGRNQQYGVDCSDTFSRVVKPATIRIVLSLALARNWPVHQLNVKNAFLNGDLTETVYIYQPSGFVDSRFPHHVCRLQRSLYGLKQAPCAWFQRFVGYALRVGFTSIRCDSSIFIYQHGTERIISPLHKEFDMTDLGALNYFLEISVTRDARGMFLSQKKYAMKLLERAHMSNCNATRTPVDTESKLGSDTDPVSDSTLYRSLAGGLQYLTFTRPDISYAVQQICLHMHDPREPHLAALKRVLRYIRGTLDHDLQLHVSPTTQLNTYTDADWAGCPVTRRVVAETAWIRNLLRELHNPLFTATLVYCNNVSALYMSTNHVQHQRTKHIEIDIHFVRDMVARGQVRILHVPSRYQYVDIFTKGLPTVLFEEFRTSLSVWSSPAQT